MNLKSTLLALTLTLVSSSSVYAASYQVKSGDTLSQIGKSHKTTTSILMKNNKLSNTTIYVGQSLNIPTVIKSVPAKPQTTAKAIPYSASDVDLLARLITAEASGESAKGMLSVGAVVVNRVQSSQFPNSISAVINQKCSGYYQFTPVKNGMIKKTASKAAVSAATKALKGTDPTKGALFFFDKTVSSKYLTSKPVAASIGNLTFAH